MLQKKKVVLYGRTLFIAGLGESLSADPGLEIRRVEAGEGNDLERMCHEVPDIIIVEMGVASGNLTLSLLREYPTVTLIALNPESERLLILSVKQQTVLAAADLEKVIWTSQPCEKE